MKKKGSLGLLMTESAMMLLVAHLTEKPDENLPVDIYPSAGTFPKAAEAGNPDKSIFYEGGK